ncbi:MFS transporter [Rhodococcus spongiicola]|uniref:MFS transporter n=1 Tax=Rhodococcus spongiicola TaxID=2487352 RepID=A0A3S3ZJX6_9NOCA|nr:MFS transporter [Rhodococcus spongiicola]RVW02446.1 MFS transporter [Rhodococcus spongiicola]
MLLLCWLAFTMTSVDRSTWGPASVFVGEDLGVPLASLGVFATAYYIGYVCSNAMTGVLSDRFGGREVVTASLSGAGLFMIVFGSTTSAVVGISVQAVIGFFAGADYAAGIKLIASWFQPKDLGKAMGLFTSATSLGTVIANTVVPWMINHYSWHASYRLFGAISIVTAITCYVILRPGPVVNQAHRTNDQKRPSAWRTLITNRDLLLVSLAGFGGFWGTYGFVIWSNALLIEGHGVSGTAAGFIVAVFAGTAVVGKPLIGILGDKINSARKPAIVILVLFAGILVFFGTLDHVPTLLIVAPVLGLVGYGYLPLLVAMIPRLVSSDVTGRAAGATNAFWQVASTLVPLAIGAVFAATDSFLAAFCALSVGPLAGAVILYFVNENGGNSADPGSRSESEKTLSH